MFIIKTPWKSYWRHSSIVTANFDQLLGTGLMSLLATVDVLFPATERPARYIVCSSSNWWKPRTWDRQHQELETDSINPYPTTIPLLYQYFQENMEMKGNICKKWGRENHSSRYQNYIPFFRAMLSATLPHRTKQKIGRWEFAISLLKWKQRLFPGVFSMNVKYFS